MQPWRRRLHGLVLAMLALGSTTHAGDAIDYLALGDSYTIGEGIEASGRWPVQLAQTLREEGIALDDPRMIATTGWTTDELSAAIDAAEPPGTFGFVSLAIGVNNQYRGRSAEDYRGEFARLLTRAIGLAGGRADRVLVLSIPDWGATRFGAEHSAAEPAAAEPGRDLAWIARELDAYNAIASALCSARGVVFVDITPLSRARGGAAQMLADDGLHPSAAMYAEWMRLALPVARKQLSTP